MAPKAASMALLFHPKKNAKKPQPVSAQASSSSSSSSTSPRKHPNATPRPKPPPPKSEESDIVLPEGDFKDFKLMSSALNGWKYDLMKFDSRKPVEISTWAAPIKLNRKELRREEAAVVTAPEAVGPMLGPDGKPVIGVDGRVVMVDAEGRPIHLTDGGGTGATSGQGGKGRGGGGGGDRGGNPNAKKRFQKKTRQVFYVPEEVRQLRREERYPWVMEDSTQTEVWVGQMEEASKSETHGFIMPAANDVFKFVPAHRWYKFQKKLKHDLPTDTAKVESMYSESQKRDPHAWLANRTGKGPSAATTAMFKAEAEGRTISGSPSGQSLGPGGRRLKAVDSGRSLFDDDDEDGNSKRRREKELGEEGDLDEQVYEEDFADDEEKMEVDDNDEEAKELEERLKREYKTANKTREGHIDESDEEDTPELSKQGKAMQKLIRNREGNDAYDSDEEKNPYASSEEEEEEEEIPAVEPPALTQPPSTPATPQSESRSQTPAPKPSVPKAQPSVSPTKPNTVPSPSLGGHSVVAKRATSPKAPKIKPSLSRGNSPLGSRATSPVSNSRATSPVPTNVPSPSNGVAKPNNKRKADDGPQTPTATHGGPVPPKAKKRKAHPAGVPAGELEDKMVIDWLRTTANASTRDCIQHFTPYLTDEAKKSKFTALVKEVAQLKGGFLVLRNAYRVSATSPVPASAS